MQPAEDQYPPAVLEPEGEEISLREILEVLLKNKWLILACFVVVLAGVALYTFRQAPVYEASSTIYVSKSQSSSPQLNDIVGFQPGFNYNMVANEIEVLKSRRIAQRVAEQLLDIAKVPGTDQPLTLIGMDAPRQPNEIEVAQRLQGRIHVQPVDRGVDVIRLTASSTIPEEAALVADLYADEYVEYNRMQSRSKMTASREFLDEVTSRYQEELRSTEQDLTNFLNQEQVVAPDAEAAQLIEQVSGLQQELNQARLQLGMLQAEVRSLEDQIERIRPGLAQQISSGDNLVIDRLVDEIAKLEVEIETMYARNPGLRQNPSQSPELVRNQEALKSLRTELNQRSKRLVENVGVGGDRGDGGESGGAGIMALRNLQQQIVEKKIQASALEARSDIVEEQLGRAKAQLGDIPRKEYILRGLERSRQTTEQLYITLIEKLQEAKIAEQSELGNVDVLDHALVPASPVKPNVQMNLMLGAVFGLMLGVGLAFVRNALDNKVRKPEDLRKRGHEVIGVVPRMDRVIQQDFEGRETINVEGHDYSTSLIALLNPLSPVAEAYRRLRTNIQHSRPDQEVRMVMVTSASPGEGKTVTAMNLAVTMAQAGRRTLYVDADLRRPKGHEVMGVDREPGLVELLFDTIPDNMEQFATELDSYLYVMPAGHSVPNPAEVLGSKKMQKHLARWRQEFDVVIVDTPPTLLVTDALILGSQADAAIAVCSAGETNLQAVDGCVDALNSVGSEVIGVLLNRFDSKAAYGSYKYGYGYGHEYGYYQSYYGQNSKPGRKPKRLGRL